MKCQFFDEDTSAYSAEYAKEFVINLPLQRWPKIPRVYAPTRYDLLADHLVEGSTVYRVCEIDCQVVERIFGLEIAFEGEAARWKGTRVILFENADRTNVFRLLAKMWRIHGLLRLFPEHADYMNKLTAAIQSTEEAFLGTSDHLDQVAAQARALLSACAELSPKPRGTPVPVFFKRPVFLLKGVESLTRPWPQGY